MIYDKQNKYSIIITSKMSYRKDFPIEIIIILLIIICFIPYLFLMWTIIQEKCFNDTNSNNDFNSNNDIEIPRTTAIILPIIESREVVIL